MWSGCTLALKNININTEEAEAKWQIFTPYCNVFLYLSVYKS